MVPVRRTLFQVPILFLFALLVSVSVWGSPTPEVIEKIDYTPNAVKDFDISSPQEQGLDSMLVARLFSRASKVDTTRSVLVVKNGRLVAEAYFHGGWIGRKERVQSVTKSFTSALTGIAVEQGYLSSIDRPMLDFFPELVPRISDVRKRKITIRHLLQMRAGYPWEESTAELFKMLYHGFRPSLLVDVPVVRDPGSGFEYSNLSAHLLGIVVARATGMDLRTFAEKNLFAPLDIEAGEWIKDWEGYNNGHADLHLTARDMTKFGLLYLNGGRWNGRQIVPSAWVRDSLTSYSRNAWRYRVGRNFTDMEYGYLWWSARAGKRRFNFAWGHGGQQIAIVPDQNLVVVVTADPLFGQHGDGPWKLEKDNLNLVGDFVESLPQP